MSRSKRYARGTADAAQFLQRSCNARERRSLICHATRNCCRLINSQENSVSTCGRYAPQPRTGRLDVQCTSRSVFGRPIRFATRSAASAFMERYYRRSYSRTARRPPPLDTHVPPDFANRLLQLRRTLRLTQAQLANEIGAASKAVVYQWESLKRTPSPVVWQRIEQFEKTSVTARRQVLV